MSAYVLNLLLAFVGLALVVSPGLVFAAFEAPEFFGRRPRPRQGAHSRPVVRSRWAVA